MFFIWILKIFFNKTGANVIKQTEWREYKGATANLAKNQVKYYSLPFSQTYFSASNYEWIPIPY
jgi:hypothetical protein